MPFIPAAIGAVAGGIGAVASGAGGLLASGIGALGSFAGSAGGASLLSFGAQALMSKGSQSQQSSSGAAAPQVYALPAAPTTAKAKTVADESVKNKRIAISRNRTIFTDPLGLNESEKSGLSLKTLTGA